MWTCTNILNSKIRDGGGGEIGLESRQFIYDENVGPEGGGGMKRQKLLERDFEK